MAENETNNTQEQAVTTPNYDEIFAKLDAILDKRADGLAKSALKDNGVDEGEIGEIVKAYRSQRQSKAAEKDNALTQAQKTIEDLQKQLSDRAIDDAMRAAAMEFGVDAKQLPYVIRLAERDGVLGADNIPDANKAAAAINKVLEDVHALKASANTNKGFQPVGVKAGESASLDDNADKKLRSYFGLK